ncbi:SMP-30/gluconolactonase/LRE family protein, partial [Chitinophaga sp.]|uniref:SMP-30/gluconolactonase/LRE family protein n=1 Tax=Chitinophaga sp. TaxID=1869181 RepID=UPI0026289C05
MKCLATVLLSLFTTTVSAQNVPYIAHDLTKENMFSTNIEGPNFDSRGRLFVVNFKHDGTVGLISPHTGRGSVFVQLPDSSIANSIVFDRQGNMLLADFVGHNILKVNMKTRDISVFCHSGKFNQPNDFCINAKGQLFASDPNWKSGTGQIWRIDPDGTPTLLDGNMGTTNGICLSPDEKILYVNESVQRKIWKFDVDEAGNISNKRLFAEFPDFGFDGMKTDREGNLYVTRYGKGTIAMLRAVLDN